MYSQQYLDSLDSTQYDDFLFWSGQISKKGLDSTPNSDIMEPMNDNIEIQGDLRDEYLAIQEAEADAEVQLVDEEELKVLLREVWEEEAEKAILDEEYTDEDAFRDFYSDQYEEWN
tara:strand:+ start:199 stop:546 length:348 start_codon:yes stop_codon:yes gene_type:complete